MVYVCEQWSQDGLRVWTVGDQSGSGHSGQYHDQHQASSHLQHIPAHGHTQHSHNSQTFISDAYHSLPSNIKLFLWHISGEEKEILPYKKTLLIFWLHFILPSLCGKVLLDCEMLKRSVRSYLMCIYLFLSLITIAYQQYLGQISTNDGPGFSEPTLFCYWIKSFFQPQHFYFSFILLGNQFNEGF